MCILVPSSTIVAMTAFSEVSPIYKGPTALCIQSFVPDRSGALRPPSLLRTVRDGFPSHGSGIPKGRHGGAPRLLYLMRPILLCFPEM